MPEAPPKRSEVIKQVQFALRSMGGQLGRLNDNIARLVALRGGDIELLDHLGRRGAVSPNTLAAELHVHPATMTGILDRLEEGGWIVRERDTEDRRKVRLRVVRTRAPELVKRYGPMNSALLRLCSQFTDEQLLAIRDFLAGVGEAANAVVEDLHQPGN